MEWVVAQGVSVMQGNNQGFAALHCAAAAGHIPALEWLAEHGVSVAARDTAGFTALHFAALKGEVSGLQMQPVQTV
jgi:ankyrin repeat protein